MTHQNIDQNKDHFELMPAITHSNDMHLKVNRWLANQVIKLKQEVVSLREKLRSDCCSYLEKERVVAAELKAGVAPGELLDSLTLQHETLRGIEQILSLVDIHNREEIASFSKQLQLKKVYCSTGYLQREQLLFLVGHVLGHRERFFETTKHLDTFRQRVNLLDVAVLALRPKRH